MTGTSNNSLTDSVIRRPGTCMGWLLILLMALPFQPVHSGEYDWGDEKLDAHFRQKAEEWVIRGEALVRRIERLLGEWRTEKNRDLDRAAVQQALSDLQEFIRRKEELKKAASNECRKANIRIDECATVARYKERLEKLNGYAKKLKAMLDGGIHE